MNFTRFGSLILKEVSFFSFTSLKIFKDYFTETTFITFIVYYCCLFVAIPNYSFFNHLILCPLEKEQESDDSDTVAVVESSHYSLPAPRR